MRSASASPMPGRSAKSSLDAELMLSLPDEKTLGSSSEGILVSPADTSNTPVEADGVSAPNGTSLPTNIPIIKTEKRISLSRIFSQTQTPIVI